MGSAVRALVVSEDPIAVERWSLWLERAGFSTLDCPGPRESWWCPRLEGDPCPRRQLAEVAVVDEEAFRADDVYEVTPGRSEWCTKVPDDGATIVVARAVGTLVEEPTRIAHPGSASEVVDAARRALQGSTTSVATPRT